MRSMVTIGVYGFDGESFLQRLQRADVRLLLDVRQRRGVRGSQYAWANARRLQAALAQAQIAYEHHPALAPTTALRQLQYAQDARQGVGKRSRRELAAEYTRRYTTEILDRADLATLVMGLPDHGLAALLCVERDPEACHRSLIAQRLTEQYHITITDLCDRYWNPGLRDDLDGGARRGGRRRPVGVASGLPDIVVGPGPGDGVRGSPGWAKRWAPGGGLAARAADICPEHHATLERLGRRRHVGWRQERRAAQGLAELDVAQAGQGVLQTDGIAHERLGRGPDYAAQEPKQQRFAARRGVQLHAAALKVLGLKLPARALKAVLPTLHQ